MGGDEHATAGCLPRHPHHLFILGQDQVVSAERNAEYNGRDAFETMDPLLPLGSLASHVEHPARQR